MTDAKLLRLSAVLIVLAGYVFVFRSGEARIGAQAAANAQTAQQLAEGERAVAERGSLERDRARLRAGLRRLDVVREAGALVARYVRDAAALAAERHCAIVAITGNGTQSSAPAGPPAAGGAFEAIALETTVEGRYADVLATIRALSGSPVLAAVDVASLSRKNPNTTDATVTAVLHVALQRLAAASAEAADARAR